eukprot:TRINITY_DN30952_c0_g2_i1.p1 TRINITY_DN30952_c0_g2~~TRINITY_DN30952_c0_g2_i1.p1  ORF type:complete len:220 (-),score=6.02 TRINITY_DN30952_c0_g2_i1:773-1432(-)
MSVLLAIFRDSCPGHSPKQVLSFGYKQGRSPDDVVGITLELGFFLNHETVTTRHTNITHLIWADNVFSFAGSMQDLVLMQENLQMVLSDRFKWRWKPESFEYLHVNRPGPCPEFFRVGDNCFNRRTHMDVLGTAVTDTASSEDMLQKRLLSAGRLYWNSAAILRRPAPMKDRLDAWRATCQSCANYSSRSLIPSHTLLQEARASELTLLMVERSRTTWA